MIYKTNIITGSGYLRTNNDTELRTGIWLNFSNKILFYKDAPICRIWNFKIKDLKLNQLLL